MKFNYSKICSELLQTLPKRDKEIIWRRFGLGGGERETLQELGDSHGLTRERIRQIQEGALSKIKPKLKQYEQVAEYFIDHLRFSGNLKKEDILLNSLGGEKFKNHVFFLLTVKDPFFRFPESETHHSFWTIEPKSFGFAQKVINLFRNLLLKKEKPLALEQLSSHQILGKNNLEKVPINNLSLEALKSFLEISKEVQQNQEGFFGLPDWPEINPKGIKDKAYLVFKKEQKPLHFTQVAKLIGDSCNIQTCHNELIKDPRFVLVGRGTYALKEWGYRPGQVRDIIVAALKAAKKPLSKEEILEKVLKQRLVKQSTILLNLNNKKYFAKNKEGEYILVNRRV